MIVPVLAPLGLSTGGACHASHARVSALGNLNVARHHSDNRVLHAVKHDRLPDDVVAQAEALFPQSV